MTRAVLIAALVAALAGGASLWWVARQRDQARADLARTTTDLATASAQLDQVQQALEVHRVYLRQAEEAAQRAQGAEADALQQEGADAPLSPYLRGVLDRVR